MAKSVLSFGLAVLVAGACANGSLAGDTPSADKARRFEWTTKSTEAKQGLAAGRTAPRGEGEGGESGEGR
jgi:hypothetical protein